MNYLRLRKDLQIGLFNILLLIMCSSAIYADTNDRQSLNEITSNAKSFIENELNIDPKNSAVTIKALDNRLRLHRCSTPLNVFWPPGAQKSSHTSVGVECQDHKPWKIYVGAHIKVFSNVWVTTTTISRGTVIEAENVKIERKDMSSAFSQYIPEQRSPIGFVAKRPLRMGDVIYESALTKPIAVKRGQKVQIIARKNGLEIRSNAIAMSNGAMGERIRVRNSSTQKEMEGILSENNVVLVNI